MKTCTDTSLANFITAVFPDSEFNHDNAIFHMFPEKRALMISVAISISYY